MKFGLLGLCANKFMQMETNNTVSQYRCMHLVSTRLEKTLILSLNNQAS